MASLLLSMIYVCFVSIGLPDALLGSAWPDMYVELGASVGAESIITTIITASTIVSTLATAPLLRRLETGKLTVISVGMITVAILGFAASTSLWQLCLLAVPFGLGAGAVDASLNNYVALHYEVRHMSWLHCCWGIGASVSPEIMGWALAGPLSWHAGYIVVGIVQACMTAVLFFSLPLWRRAFAPGVGEAIAADATAADAAAGSDGEKDPGKKTPADHGLAPAASRENAPSYIDLLRLPGALSAILSFGCYSGFEAVCDLWCSSYLVMACGIEEPLAADMLSFFYMGLTGGRLLSGIIATRVGGKNLIRLGQAVAGVGVLLLVFGQAQVALSVAIALIGLGCAPICPTIIFLTPSRFGKAVSPSMVSLQMGCAYAGSILMPMFVSFLVSAGGAAFMPWVLVVILAFMALFGEMTNAKLSKAAPALEPESELAPEPTE